ncbi:putative defense protein 3 [Leptopilina boulardi]|uniref:putative defense protein 3 n=1 Tax=Leptopilina boulardi TaxID=63433 RepID=UPI0021F66AE9|nr:putative defense protein 3 [Leptopilina boulardi]XP_051159927.1 putative defense protein 3 [Leptopilina boulardi]XP_051159928.1 putative defense protein 3 [Leptopilina boulardi]
MASGKQLAILLLTIVASLTFVEGFPDGAPVDACVKPRPNQPYHGQAKPQPLATNPYAIIASAEQFQPGAQITVKIVGDTFKGFFLQARDVNTNEWIGNWGKTENTVPHSECSAITHADPRDKQQATLTWNAPLNARGHVYFTGSVLKDYATFWADITSRVGK